MNFKEKILSKSNSYTHYKKENEMLKKQIEELKSERNNTLKEEYYRVYGGAGNFCNWSYIQKFLEDDIEDQMKAVTKHLNPHDRKFFKLYYLRAMASSVFRWETLYFEKEIEDQKKTEEFKKSNIQPGQVAGFKFEGEYNIHSFMDLNLNESDLEYLKDKDIIDGGAFTGDTSLPLSRITDRKVHAFEPFEESFEILKRNIANNNIDNIVAVKKSLGNMNGERSLFLSGTNVQGITSDPNMRNYDEEIRVQETTVDRYVEENNLDVGLITVDVEGAEMDLLEGAINTIKTQRPILNISIYHSISDYFSIIPWIADLNLDYEFRIVKEQPYSFMVDTIVQCRQKR